MIRCTAFRELGEPSKMAKVEMRAKSSARRRGRTVSRYAARTATCYTSQGPASARTLLALELGVSMRRAIMKLAFPAIWLLLSLAAADDCASSPSSRVSHFYGGLVQFPRPRQQLTIVCLSLLVQFFRRYNSWLVQFSPRQTSRCNTSTGGIVLGPYTQKSASRLISA